jgi:dihydroxy-acid dehydratase
VDKRQLSVEIPESEIESRLRNWQPPKPRFATGVFAKYASRVSSASVGAVTG